MNESGSQAKAYTGGALTRRQQLFLPNSFFAFLILNKYFKNYLKYLKILRV